MKKDNVVLHHITIHEFRHGHASSLFSARATIKEVQDCLDMMVFKLH